MEHFEEINSDFLNDFIIEKGKHSDNIVFLVKKKESREKIAILVCLMISDLRLKSNKKILMIKRTWCNLEFRNKGIITNLYRYVYNSLGFALISDIEQTPETIAVWNKLRDQWPVKMIDCSNGEISEIDEKELYNKSKRFALIVESLDILNMFKSVNSTLLNDYIFLEGESD